MYSKSIFSETSSRGVKGNILRTRNTIEVETVRDVGGDKCFDGRRLLTVRKTVLSGAQREHSPGAKHQDCALTKGAWKEGEAAVLKERRSSN